MKIKVSPSILSADFSELGKELKKIKAGGADMVHVDVMDGHFVPNITIGPVVINGMKKATKLPLDVHLMIERPRRFIDAFVKAGSDMITMHIETINAASFRQIARDLQKKNIKVGISLNPATRLERIKIVLDLVDFVLIMSVNPGFSGQEFMPEVLPKIKKLRAIFNRDIAVDGGINEKTAKEVIAAGANVVAAGSYIFKSDNYKQTIRSLKCAPVKTK
ncbi:MAG: ribulose-phosphate 3-epimerase [Candidatus Omnitrophota bacterium]